MTYGRALLPNHEQPLDGAVVSHLAELVRGDLLREQDKAPSSGPSGHPLPKGRRCTCARASEEHP